MGPETDVWPQCTSLDIGYEQDEDFDNINQPKPHTKPPRNLHPMRHCISQAVLAASSDSSKSTNESTGTGLKSPQNEGSGYWPVFRSGSCSEMGPKPYMEDEYICVDDLRQHLEVQPDYPFHGAFYGVFDGHGGIDAASFTKRNILEFILEDSSFLKRPKKAIKNAFAKVDHALADTRSLDNSSGTTALTALILGRNMLIANAGDSRAVLGKRGRAIELSTDHKPSCTSEKMRIEKLGGVIYDGYLNGQLSVARALGDWHMKGPKGSESNCPLSAEPELEEVTLCEEDEFLIIGCDGLWDVMSSQYAVTIVRKELMSHNNPQTCSAQLVMEASKRNSCDNLTVVVVCFSQDPPPKIEIPNMHRRRSISAEGLDVLKGVLEITSEVCASEGDGYRQANESMKAKLAREALSQLLELVESRVYKRMSILEEVSILMSRLNLMVDCLEFSRFYNFVFFICRENGQRSITVSRAIMAWKLVLSGRFRLLNHWCSFIENNQRHNISEDTWRQVLAFSRCVHENLEGYDPEGAWPVLIDEFVEHMYRMTGSEDAFKLCCKCGDSEAKPVFEALPGLKVFPGAKRKLDEDSHGQELQAMDAFADPNAVIISKRRHSHNDSANMLVKHEKLLGCSKPPCGAEGCLSKGFAQLFSRRSCLQFDHESRVSYT